MWSVFFLVFLVGGNLKLHAWVTSYNTSDHGGWEGQKSLHWGYSMMSQGCRALTSTQDDPAKPHRYLPWGLQVETFQMSAPWLHLALLSCNVRFVSSALVRTSYDLYLHCRLIGDQMALSKPAVLDWAPRAVLTSYSSKYNPKMTCWVSSRHSLCGSSHWMFWIPHQ